MNSALVIFLSALGPVLPILSIAWLWRGGDRDKTTRLLKLSITTCAVLFAYLAGLWAFYSYYLKFIAAALFIFAFYRYATVPGKRGTSKPGKLAQAAGFLVLVALVLLNMVVAAGFIHGKNPVKLSFPLRNGTYYVLQGGNSMVSNVFHGIYKTINAVDIVKLNAFGNRAGGLFPDDLSSYEIFGETIYSPCEGEVLEAVDGFPDLTPHSVDTGNPKGNHVVIECKGVKVLIGHMMNGSVLARQGTAVKEGQAVGRVGNSGNTFEPHLHIHAAISPDASLRGPSVPILFNSRFLSLNSMVKMDEK